MRDWAKDVFDVFESHRLEIEEIVEAEDFETVVMAEALEAAGLSE